jgi:outer membrane protein assembly factor BamA
MRLALIRRYVVAALICAPLYAPALRAQLPQNQETCTPLSTFTQLIKSLDEPMARTIVDQITFDGPAHVSPALRGKAIAELTHRDFDDNSEFESTWLNQLRGLWLDEGYFKVEATTRQEFLEDDPVADHTRHVRMIVHLDQGDRFRLGSVQFRTADPDQPFALPVQDLRKSFAMRTGDIFSAAKVREGLDSLKRLYRSDGYIDIMATPLVDIADRRILLTIELDQRKQFRVGTVEILGLNPAMETLLKAKLKRGSIYNDQAVDDFFNQNASSLPPYLSRSSIEYHRDMTHAIIDFRLSVAQDCPTVRDD